MAFRIAWNDGDDSFARPTAPGVDLAGPFVANAGLAQLTPFLGRQAMTLGFVDDSPLVADRAAPLGSAGKTLVAQPAFEPFAQSHGIPTGPVPQDFAQSDEVAFIAGVYTDGTLPLYAFSAWNDDNPATYTGGFTNSAKWGAQTSETPGGTIKYFFTPSSSWSATEQQMLAAGLALWSDVANISFTQTSVSNQAQIVFTRGSNGSAATSVQTTDSTGSAGHTGGSILWQLTKATISIDTSVSGFGPIDGTFTTQGGYPVMTLLHEEGHAIGLGHGGPYNGTVNASQQQFSAWDTRLWSIMSYIEPRTTSAAYFNSYPVTGTDWGFGPSGFRSDPTGLMPLDILAAQQLYGMPSSTPLSGGQVFGFHCNVTGPSAIFFDFTQNSVPIITLWDMGTGNTLDLSGFTSGSTINLNPGTFSSCAGMVNNLGIAFGTLIDTLVGTGGVDTVTANNDGDTITGGAGNDVLNGGSGSDTAVFSGARTDYTYEYNSVTGTTLIVDRRFGTPDGNDKLTGIEFAQFTDGTVSVASLTGNATPSLSGGGNTIGYTEQAAPVPIDPNIVVSFDGATLTGAAIIVTSGWLDGDGLIFEDQNGIHGTFMPSEHKLLLFGGASPAAYQAALRTVSFYNDRDDPTAGGDTTRTVSFQVNDRGNASTAITSTVNITPIDDPLQAHNDAFATTEAATIGSGLSLFADNGSGADGDPDGGGGPALQVVAVNGQSVLVGTQVALASGALVTVNANGTFSYNPNHAFDSLPGEQSGAANIYTSDSFTYAVPGGSTATVTLNITGVDSDDTLTGTHANNLFDGGIGTDTLVLTGAYADYNVTYDTPSGRLIFNDMRSGSPDGFDGAKNVEYFSFTDGLYTFDTQARVTSLTTPASGGAKFVKTFDAGDTASWATITAKYEANGSLSQQDIATDAGAHWFNLFDTSATRSWFWQVYYAVNGNNVTTVTTNDDGTHVVQFDDPANQYAAWSQIVAVFDVNGNIASLSGTDDLGRPNHVALGDMQMALDTLPWQFTPFDPNHDAAPVNLALTGGGGIDVLFGFDGNDTLNGGGGNDYLDGGRGNDMLTGGAGDDRFVFHNNGSGLDVITDFAPGNGSNDVIELHAYGLANFTALQAMMTQVGADVVITFDPSDTITLQHVTLSQLNSGDFLLS